MVGIDRVADAALGLDAERKRMDELGAADRAVLGEHEDRGRDRAGGMDHRLQVRVVEVEDVRADAVEQGGAEDVDAFAAAEDAGLGRAAERTERANRDIDRLVAGRTHGASEPVEERAHRVCANRRRQVTGFRGDDVAGERAGHVLGGRRGGGSGGHGIGELWRRIAFYILSTIYIQLFGDRGVRLRVGAPLARE